METFKQKLLVISLVLYFVLATLQSVDSRLNCTRIRPGFKCVATDQDSADRFIGTIRNIYSTDISLDIFSVVDICENMRRPPPPPPPRQLNSTSNSGGPMARANDVNFQPGGPRQRSSTALLRRLDKGTKITRGANMTLSMERVKMRGYCSKSIIKNCRNSNNIQMDCAQLVSVT